MLASPVRQFPAPRIESVDTEATAAYWRFYREVSAAQVARWLPRRPSRILDLSGGHSAALAALAGHDVVCACEGRSRPSAARVRPVRYDGSSLAFIADGCVDAVLADDRVLSRHLLTEATVAEIARVLRPGGRVLAAVDSLVLGMAVLADQHRWAELTDLPHAEVVLVPWPDGTISRCFAGEHIEEMFAETGLEVEWIRPRTVLSPSTVETVLAEDPRALPRLVRAELATRPNDESVGVQLVVSARRQRDA